MNVFFIVGLPRTRSAWLANFFTYGERSFCFHEGLRYVKSVEGLAQRFSELAEAGSVKLEYLGDADPSVVLHFDEVNRLFPEAKWVFVHRLKQAAHESYRLLLQRHGIASDVEDGFEAVAEKREAVYLKADREFRSKRRMFEISFSGMDDRDAMQRVWEFLLPNVPWDEARWELLNELRVEAHVPKVLERMKAQGPCLLFPTGVGATAAPSGAATGAGSEDEDEGRGRLGGEGQKDGVRKMGGGQAEACTTNGEKSGAQRSARPTSAWEEDHEDVIEGSGAHGVGALPALERRLQEEFNLRLKEACGQWGEMGNYAWMWMQQLWEVLLTWDHCVDGDEIDKGMADRAWEAVVLGWAQNPFWERHKFSVLPVLAGGIATWRGTSVPATAPEAGAGSEDEGRGRGRGTRGGHEVKDWELYRTVPVCVAWVLGGTKAATEMGKWVGKSVEGMFREHVKGEGSEDEDEGRGRLGGERQKDGVRKMGEGQETAKSGAQRSARPTSVGAEDGAGGGNGSAATLESRGTGKESPYQRYMKVRKGLLLPAQERKVAR